MPKFRIVHEVEADSDGAARRTAAEATDALRHNVGPVVLVAVQRDQSYFSDMRACETCGQLTCGGECPPVTNGPPADPDNVIGEIMGGVHMGRRPPR
jgi:hypothetical protein